MLRIVQHAIGQAAFHHLAMAHDQDAMRQQPCRRDVMRHHAVPNALLPSVSLIAIGFGFVIGGAITTETVFSYPGLGLATSRAIGNTDLPMMQALFMFSSLAVILFNVAADIVLTYLDPRIRVGA